VNLTEQLSDGYCGPLTGYFGNPVWSPGGEYLAFSVDCGVGADVFLLDVDNAVRQRGTPVYINLTQDRTRVQGEEGLDWSPDSSQLVLVSSPTWTREQGNGPTNIFILDVQWTIESGEPQMVQLTNNTIVDMHYVNPAWRP
jgi:Tol biopolymer transport system component